MQNRLASFPGGWSLVPYSDCVLHGRHGIMRPGGVSRESAGPADLPELRLLEAHFRMNVYFSCSLTGGRQDQSVYAAIVAYLIDQGHAVPTAHLAHRDVMDLEQVVDPAEIYQRDVEWIRDCDALVAEVSTPSHGVGYEIAYALQLGKPVLCCFRRGARVSKMITGNDSPGLQVRLYADGKDVIGIVDQFLSGIA